jgi:hypothetical protein
VIALKIARNVLKKLLRVTRIANQETPTQREKREKIMAYLNEKLKEARINGVVISIVCLDQKSKAICCYGHQISADALFVWLNPSIGINATKYPPIHYLQIDHCRSGFFVPLSKFENYDKKNWVALINIPLSDEELSEAIPFSPSSHPTWTRK